MQWICPHDRGALSASGDELTCSACSRRYPAPEGILIFAEREDRAAAPAPHTPLDDLWTRMQGVTTGTALTEFCSTHGCSRAPFAADWKFFFPVRAGTTVLELGAGAGEDTADFTASGARVVAVVPTLVNARIVARVVQERAAPACTLAVMDSIERLPLPDQAVAAVALDSAAASGFGVRPENFPHIAAEWKRIVAPGGAVFLGLGNRLHDLPGARHLRRALASRPRPESLNRAIKRAGAGQARPGTQLGIGPALRAMTRAGFDAPAIHAPLPDENDARVVVPLDDARALRYFLSHLIRRNSPLVRAAVHGANTLVALDLLRHVVPYYYLLFHAPERH